MPASPRLRISGVGASHAGRVRADNEDSGFVGPTCILVADGVGGAAAGEVASATSAYAVSAHLLAHSDADPADSLRAGIRLAQEQLALGVDRVPDRAGMASTLTALATDGRQFALAHVGDSRGYVLRDGQLHRVTTDHTYVQQLLDQGSLSEHEARAHPWRNVVLRTLNGHVGEHGDVRMIPLHPGDRVLLASDGLTDLVSEPRIEELLLRHEDDAAVTALLDEALSMGGHDNVTCVLGTIVEGPPVVVDGQPLGAVRDPHNIVDAAAVRSHTA